MRVYFGRPWLRGMAREFKIDTPVGEVCEICHEDIAADDQGTVQAGTGGHRVYLHAECQALGIVGHTYGICSCTGYDTTSRASALELWQRMRGSDSQL